MIIKIKKNDCCVGSLKDRLTFIVCDDVSEADQLLGL